MTAQAEAKKPHRRRLPSERQSVTHKFEIAGHEGYITVGCYPDGQPGEMFVRMAKEGSTVAGLMDSMAISVSVALQYGVPLRDLVNKFAHVRFEPSGFTGNPEIPIAKSIVDYIFRWLGSRFLPKEDRDALGILDRSGDGESEAPSSIAASRDAGGPRALPCRGPAPPAVGVMAGSAGTPAPAASARGGGRRAAAADPPVGIGPGPAASRPSVAATATRTATATAERPRPRPGPRTPSASSSGARRRSPSRPRRTRPLRRLRLDHGAQRLVLQVPQLRQHERLQLSLRPIASDLNRRAGGAGAGDRHARGSALPVSRRDASIRTLVRSPWQMRATAWNPWLGCPAAMGTLA